MVLLPLLHQTVHSLSHSAFSYPSDLLSSSKCLFSLFSIQQTHTHSSRPSNTIPSPGAKPWPAHPRAKLVDPILMPFAPSPPSLPGASGTTCYLLSQSLAQTSLCPAQTLGQALSGGGGLGANPSPPPPHTHTHILGLPDSHHLLSHLIHLVSADPLPKYSKGGKAWR